MKVSFIYAHEGEEWSTPLSLIKEFYSRGWETEIVTIGSNRTGIYTDENLKNWIRSTPHTDIVIHMDFGRFDSFYLNKQHLSKAFWVMECGDDPQNFEKNLNKTYKFDYMFTPDHDCYLKYKALYNDRVDWITHFADTNVQYHMKVPIDYIAVTTRGMGGSFFLDSLTQHANGSIGNKNGLMGIDHTKFLNSGMMVIQNSRYGEITRRIFEGMACGKIVITDRLNESKKLHELFIENEEIVFYDDLTDCINKINYYYDNNYEREKIAFNGMKKTLANHTQKNVVDKIIDKWKSYQLV